MIKGKLLLGTLLISFLIFSCQKEEFNKYERPEWLEGKVYTLMKGEDNLQTFTKCVELVGYDEVIDASGSYTVFAPTDEAFEFYFSSHPTYNSVDDIPFDELDRMVKFHIVQNPWDKKQLSSLDVNGWIDPEDEFNDKPRGFKRQTLLRENDKKFGVSQIPGRAINLRILDTLSTPHYRMVHTDSRKYAPLFYQEFFNVFELQLSDYSYYFGRDFENADDIYFAGAKVLGDEIFAENGFVYSVDRVVEPFKSAEEILSSGETDNNYSKFLEWVNYFPDFVYNERATFNQPGADLGLEVDSLFDLTYPLLAFNISAELTRAPAGMSFQNDPTVRFHHGLIAPTNQALEQFENEFLKGTGQWGSFEEAPYRIKKIIVNSYFSQRPIFPSDLNRGIFNGERDIIRFDESSVVEKRFASNSTFLGVNQPVVPRALSGVTGPVYRQRGYSTFMNVIEYTGLLSALKRENQDYAFFVIEDQTLRQDSTLFYESRIINNELREFVFSFQRATLDGNIRQYEHDKNRMRLLFLNQIAVETPRGIARREFLKTLGGNYLVWNNENNTVRGFQASQDGFPGGTTIPEVNPVKISESDNGNTYSVNAWFRFVAERKKFVYIDSINNQFNALMNRVGQLNVNAREYYFAPESQIYTVFVPSREALEQINTADMSNRDLETLLRLHFIQGELIFTDGKLQPGYYKTAALKPGSTNQYYEIYIDPGIDEIRIGAKEGGIHTSVLESDEFNNRISIYNLVSANNRIENFHNIMSTGVVHKVDKAFTLDLVDVR